MLRCNDKMNMIGHQAAAVHDQIQTLRLLSQKVKKHPPVIIYEENSLAVVTARRDMMGESN